MLPPHGSKSMIHILQGFRSADVRMTSMFADRKRLFVDLMRWSVPVVDDHYEIDQFDNAEAVYLIAIEGGEHIGSMRLLSTERPHILDTLFPDLCADGPPTGMGIVEITRLCLPCRLGRARRLATRNRLISAMVDHAAATGIMSLTGVVSASFLAQVMAMGRSEEHTSELQSLMRISYAVFCLQKKKNNTKIPSSTLSNANTK